MDEFELWIISLIETVVLYLPYFYIQQTPPRLQSFAPLVLRTLCPSPHDITLY
jgi:hypothetical protein